MRSCSGSGMGSVPRFVTLTRSSPRWKTSAVGSLASQVRPHRRGSARACAAERLAVQPEHRARVRLLGLHGERPPLRGLRQPRDGGGGVGTRCGRAESERRLGSAPGQRHAASVAARVDAARAEVHRVLEHLARQLDLGQAELVALVQVERAGQGGREQCGRAGAAAAELDVGGGAEPLAREREARVLPAVPGDRPGHVVVGEHPGARRADRGVGGEHQVDRGAQLRGIPRARHEVEVERRVHLVGPEVGGEARRRAPGPRRRAAHALVGIGDAPPRAVDA